ncbi:MAG: DUF2007 domain-containing protein [Muribaculaceae bacterium]|nr:DUF2007 domain-containing protein [Muribaculaceae bacterium]
MLKYDKSDDELVECHEFATDAEAHIAEAWLKQEGIDCYLFNEIFSSLYPVGVAPFGGIRLMVRKRDLEKANDIINQLNFSGQ